jgi:5'-nucleotidase
MYPDPSRFDTRRERVRPLSVRLLLTNDDGIASPGLHALGAHLFTLGYDVVVAAPDHDMSGAGAAIGRLHADEHIDVRRAPIPEAEELEAFAIAGPPGLAAMVGRLGAFGDPPDVVVSGINTGLNTGHSVLHSGTVGAALTAANFGGSGLAVSIEPTDPWHFATACDYAAAALAWLIDHAPTCTVLNLNVPGRPRNEVVGLRWAKLDRFGSVRAAVVDSDATGVQLEFRDTGATLDPDSDTALVAQGYATLTAISGVSETEVEMRPAEAPEPRVERSLERVPRRDSVTIPAPPLHVSATRN